MPNHPVQNNAYQVQNLLFSVRGFLCSSSDHLSSLLVTQPLYAALTSNEIANLHGKVCVLLLLPNLKAW